MAQSDLHLSFLDPQGPIAALQRVHFYEVLAVLVVFVAIPIFAVTLWFAWRYRYGATRLLYTPKWDYFLPLEIASWGGPVLIVAVLSFVLWRDTHAIDPYRPIASDQPPLRIQVIGYDWKWLFIYPEQRIATVGMLAVPTGRPLALQLTSATVMQSLFIPALGSQIYAMGGMVTQLHLEATEPGRFMGENTMYSGFGFQQEQFTTVAMAPAAFQAWVRQVRLTGIPLDERTLRALSQRGSHADLDRALPRASTAADAVYLTGVTASFFAAVVKATMDGTVVQLSEAAAPPRMVSPPGGERARRTTPGAP